MRAMAATMPSIASEDLFFDIRVDAALPLGLFIQIEEVCGPGHDGSDTFVDGAEALATVGFDRTEVEMVGDPAATVVRHTIHVDGEAGSYEFVFANRPSATNPRTSAITPYSVYSDSGLPVIRSPIATPVKASGTVTRIIATRSPPRNWAKTCRAV